jgi:hypothetical protein
MLLIRHDLAIHCPDDLRGEDGDIQLPLCSFIRIIKKALAWFEGHMAKLTGFKEMIYHEDKNPNQRVPRPDSFRQGQHQIQQQLLESQLPLTKKWVILFRSMLLGGILETGHGPRYGCTAFEAVKHLAGRSLGKTSDKLAIIANLCGYEVRINSFELERLGFDLGACVLTLALLNGDLSLTRLEDGLKYKHFPLTEVDDFRLQIVLGLQPESRIDL